MSKRPNRRSGEKRTERPYLKRFCKKRLTLRGHYLKACTIDFAVRSDHANAVKLNSFRRNKCIHQLSPY